jgi:hypothetical protein
VRLEIGAPQVTSCRDRSRPERRRCDPVDFDKIARSRIEALSECEAASAAKGLFSVGFTLDFEKNRITEIQSGKSTDFPQSTTDALLGCARKAFESASLSGIDHERQTYTVFYLIKFSPPASAQGDEAVSASGRATVTWEVALIRSAPKEGDILAHVLSGTRVVVTGRQGDWYRVKYDSKGSEGWVFKSAIGL